MSNVIRLYWVRVVRTLRWGERPLPPRQPPVVTPSRYGERPAPFLEGLVARSVPVRLTRWKIEHLLELARRNESYLMQYSSDEELLERVRGLRGDLETALSRWEVRGRR